ncbi:MAG: HEAT repeat domain-containing protein [Elusimicrobia bacterium]|nr:HEAT repeat domain-containing protein [Elusimicrobiota bacterium]
MQSFRNSARVIFIWGALLSPAAGQAPKDPRLQIGAKSLGVLSAAMRHEDADIRALAAEQWGLIGNPAAVPLLKKALEDRNPHVRIAAARSLFALGDPSGVRTVEEIVATVPKTDKKDATLAAVEQMRAVARNKVRVVGIRALAAMMSQTSVKALTQAAEDSDGGVRDAAALALARFGVGDIRSFVEALSSEDPDVRAKAARSLGEIASPGIIPELELLASDKEYPVRAAAMEALGAAKVPAALEGLRKGLGDQNELVRAKAVEAVGRIPGLASVALLEEARKAANPHIELLAVLGLARQGEAVDTVMAERALARSDIDTRMLALDILESAGGERAVSALEMAQEDVEARVRFRAAAALLKILKKPAKAGP